MTHAQTISLIAHLNGQGFWHNDQIERLNGRRIPWLIESGSEIALDLG